MYTQIYTKPSETKKLYIYSYAKAQSRINSLQEQVLAVSSINTLSRLSDKSTLIVLSRAWVVTNLAVIHSLYAKLVTRDMECSSLYGLCFSCIVKHRNI